MNFFIKICNLDKEKTDCIVVGVFKSYKLSYSAEYLDKCSNGYITSLLQSGDITGKMGEILMLYNVPKIFSKRILLVGCGEEKEINQFLFKKIINNAANFLKKTPLENIIYSFAEFNINNSPYWTIRLIVLAIKKSLYKIIKITSLNKKNIKCSSITLNALKEKNVKISKIALKHALAINHGIASAKNISNLPPNFCNPLYLSYEAEKLAKKYQNSISVEVVDIEKMKNLGMHAYLAVGNGSKNKPFMSVIKYSGKNNISKKVIALVGKGLTFDSGGISLKPSINMHEMKYDMCGAAAVYGTLIMAAELELPLKIIGILSGCENMLSNQSFRPGDVLTTMSGKTVEILNTDAEGRLVLCDSLTYVERFFSPDIVIDVATLTGACVTALGEYTTGLFSNNDDLAYELYNASKETDDKVWRLPLFSEYEKELISSVADFCNIGKGKAGAITAACFLYQFAKKCNWAHLDIAGTAWKSGRKKGATGRPVELLCQFLLNQSNYKFS